MRFKSKLSLEQVQLLSNVLNSLSKLNSSDAGAHIIGQSRSTSGVIGSLASWEGGSVFHLSEEHVRISQRSAGEDGVFCFVELACVELFLDHKIESAADNAILFELDLGQFRTAVQSVVTSLRSEASRNGGTLERSFASRTASYQPIYNSMAQSQPDEDDNSPFVRINSNYSRLSSNIVFGSQTVVLKLAKRGGLPCLCLDCFGQSLEVHHAIPVKVMRVTEVNHYLPPKVSFPDVQLELTNGTALRTIVDRLRTMSQNIYLEGKMFNSNISVGSPSTQEVGNDAGGELCLFVDRYGTSTRVFLKNLIPRFEETKLQQRFDEQDQDPQSSQEHNSRISSTSCTLKVDSKTLQTCLMWQSNNSFRAGGALYYGVSSTILCMVHDEMLVIHVLFQPRALGFFTYYIPIIYASSEEDIG